MARWRCLSCHATYSDTDRDGGRYTHACSPEIIEHAEFDQSGKQTKPERRMPRPFIRDENWHPESTPQNPRIISEGKGRIVVEGGQ